MYISDPSFFSKSSHFCPSQGESLESWNLWQNRDSKPNHFCNVKKTLVYKLNIKEILILRAELQSYSSFGVIWPCCVVGCNNVESYFTAE